MKKSFVIFVSLFLYLFPAVLHAQPLAGSYYDFLEATKDMPAGHDKTQLIIYRPQNSEIINEIRCFLRLQDEEGNDVTYDLSKVSASYEWTNSNPDVIFNYKRTYWLSGGSAMHLKLKKGKYKISFYTPTDKQNNWTYPQADTKPFQWESNVFEYDTENPAKVIFLVPTTNDNGFYNGGWYIDYKAPVYFKQQALPKRQE